MLERPAVGVQKAMKNAKTIALLMMGNANFNSSINAIASTGENTSLNAAEKYVIGAEKIFRKGTVANLMPIIVMESGVTIFPSLLEKSEI